MAELLDAALLFQRLLDESKPEGSTVAGDLDMDSFDEIPFITHSTLIQQAGNGPGVWNVTLTVNLFLDPAGAFPVVAAVYRAIHAWGEDPDAGVVADLAGIEEVEDLNAFVPVSGEVVMNNKVCRHYQGTFNIVARAH